MTLKDHRSYHGQQLLNNYELRLMAQLLEREQGIGIGTIVEGTGIAERLLRESAQLLTPEQELLLYTRIAQRNKDPFLGVRVGERINLPNYGVLASAMMASYNLSEALALLAEFAPLVSWASHSQLTTERYADEECACLTIIPTATDPAAAALEIDSTFASIQVVFNELSTEPVPFALLDMTRGSSSERLSHHRRLFGCALRTERKRNALLIAHSVLNKPLPHPQPEHQALFRDLCRQSTAMLTEKRGLVAAVRNRLLAEEGAVPSLEQIATQFDISARTLRRQLRAAGVTYQALLDESRYQESKRYLASTEMTVAVIGRRLGYADARSFRTAFRRWSGQTPMEYRAAQS
ncbi:MAG: AraC family transcriptional regulator ligand-binding domain-containing protein [Halioglobus sp.]